MAEENNTKTEVVDTDTVDTPDVTPTETPTNGFLDNLDAAYKDDPNISKFKDINGLAKSYTELSKMLGSDKVVLPKEGENYDSQMDELFSKLGMPETAAGYDLKDIDLSEDGIDTVIPVEEFSKVARELRMTPSQVEGILNFYKEDIINNNAQTQEQVSEQVNQAKVALRKEFGAAYEANMQAANKIFEGHFPSLKGTDLANNPNFVKDLVKLSKSFGETSLGETPKGGALSPQEASAEKLKLMQSDAYTNQLHPEHNAVIEKYRAYLAMENS